MHPAMTIDTGNTGFMLLCTSLVMLMTPGLAFFYGGLVGRKNVLTIMMQSFVSMGWTTVIWSCGWRCRGNVARGSNVLSVAMVGSVAPSPIGNRNVSRAKLCSTP